MRGFGLLAAAVLVLAGAVCRTTHVKDIADLVLVNAGVFTVNPEQPWAEAVAVRGEEILAVGSTREILEFVGPRSQVIDLDQAMVLPGFIDSHTHFLDGGFVLSSIQLRDAKSRQEFVDRIHEKAQGLEAGEWILNGDWDQQRFDPPEMPVKEWIDPVTPDNPVCLTRLDKHMVFVNSLALKLAGITGSTQAPPGGVIVRDPESGEPTGILKDNAIDLVTAHIPEPGWAEKKKAAAAALRHASACGVTSIHDMSYTDSFGLYQELQEEGELSARLYVYIPISEVDLYDRLRIKTPYGNDLLKIGGLKGFVDGSLGSFTALFFDPYSDDPGRSGILVGDMFPEGIMEKRIRQADEAGLQVAIHAIGDRANHIILDIFENIIRDAGPRDRRWRIEHAQHLTPDDIERLAELDILASVQPYHAIDDGRWAENKIGARRAATTYAFRSLLQAGAKLVCGSDWTVAPLDPLSGIYAAVTRRTLDGKNPDGWIPQQKISLDEAIKGYTVNGAYAEFAEDRKGSIEAGKLADLVVLDQNLFQIPPESIEDASVVMTIFNGKIVFRNTPPQ